MLHWIAIITIVSLALIFGLCTIAAVIGAGRADRSRECQGLPKPRAFRRTTSVEMKTARRHFGAGRISSKDHASGQRPAAW